MEDNPPESRVMLTIARWSWRCRPVLNLPKDILSARICPLDLGDHMLSQKFLIDVALTCSPAKTGLQWPKSAKPATHFACITSFHPFTVMSDPGHCLTGFPHWKSCFCCCWGPHKSLYVAILHSTLIEDSVASISLVTEGPPRPPPPPKPLLGPPPNDFCKSFPSQLLNSGGSVPATSSPQMIAPPCTLLQSPPSIRDKRPDFILQSVALSKWGVGAIAYGRNRMGIQLVLFSVDHLEVIYTFKPIITSVCRLELTGYNSNTFLRISWILIDLLTLCHFKFYLFNVLWVIYTLSHTDKA